MIRLDRGYGWKGFGLLLFLGAAALFFGPALRKPPELGSDVSVPAMTNIPPEGSTRSQFNAC